MGMTMTQKILAAHAGLDTVEAGQLIEAKLDIVMANDITGPMALPIIRQRSDKVFDKDKVVFVPDHFTPNKDIKSAENSKAIREYAKEQGLKWYFEQGKSGVEHAILPEAGVVTAGECIIGADSHTCTHGALGAFSTGIGSTDMAMVFAEGNLWFKVPETNRFEITGELKDNVYAKDVILNIIGQVGVDGSTYKACEFAGETVSNMSISDRMVLTNMAIEMGGKTGLVEPDKKTIDYVESRSNKAYKVFKTDLDAPSLNIIDIDVSELEPQVACPHHVDNVKAVSEVDQEIDQVFLGSCTNGRISDLRDAAKILKGKKVAKGTRMLVIPASKEVYSKALDEGLLKIFVDAGALVSAPCCGPCLGGHTGIIGPGEVSLSTSNRNFKGRQGSPDGKVYLSSAAVAAASAIEGRIVAPE